LHVDDNEYDQYYVGTKRGRVVQIGLPPPSSFSISSVRIHDILSGDNLDNDAKRGDVKLVSKPYPIFSLMCVLQNGCDDEEEDGNDYELLAGGADRYVTVWRRRKRKHQDEGSQLHSRGSWLMEEHLGPHTGWVKDMAMIKMRQKKASDDRRVFLFSIGCNCIEVWSRNGGNYQHMHKLKIESSVQMGSTLSSDILCLATASISKLNNRDDCSDGTIDGTINLLLAGGVDGRMHLWTMTTTKSETVHGNASIIFNCVGSISAHQGRVNAIAVCPVMNVVISVGNDSSIHCRQITSSLLLSSWETRIINLAVDHEGEIIAVEEDDSESSTRRGLKITSLCIVDETARQSTIAIGTSCGRLALIDITLSEIRINDCIMTQLRDTMKLDVETDEDGKEDEVVIHALCAGRRYDDIQRILVGHARGLTVWNVSIGTP
jgi:WD40 repeat protein